jgi:diguanylate cyclase (GGDEF)-like protein/PAS domain S-box-containing protein
MDELRLYRIVLESAGELVWSLDPAGRWTFLSAAGARRFYGREAADLAGQPFIEVVAPELRERDYALFRRVLEGERASDHETRHLHSDGSVIDVSLTAVALRDAQGRLIGAAGTTRDIRERQRSSVALHQSVSQLRVALESADRFREEAGRVLAYHDELTGLPNRRLFDDRLTQALHLAQRRDRKVSVLLVDLDDFKQVNDTFGRAAGDQALREAALRLSGCVRRADTLARHDGDAFAIVLSDVRTESDCTLVAEKALRSLAQVLTVGGRPLTLAASIGISLFPADAADGEALLRNADAAMYRAKQRGRNQVEFYGR